MKKNQSSYLDSQGRELLNFQISYLIYGFVALLLCFMLIGFVLLPVLVIAPIILTIIGIVRAAEGLGVLLPADHPAAVAQASRLWPNPGKTVATPVPWC